VEDFTKMSDKTMDVFRTNKIEVQTISDFTESMAKAKVSKNGKTVLDATVKATEVVRYE